MKKIIILLLTILALLGCAKPYTRLEYKKDPIHPIPTYGVIVSIPADGGYDAVTYNGSGLRTASVVSTAFRKYTNRVEIVTPGKIDEYLKNVNPDEYRYYVKPYIHIWVDRATSWSYRIDYAKIELTVYDLQTNKEIAHTVFMARGPCFTAFLNPGTGDIIDKGVDNFVESFYY